MSFLRHGRSTSHHGSNHGHDWTIPDPGGLWTIILLVLNVGNGWVAGGME